MKFRIPPHLRDDKHLGAKLREVTEGLRANPLHAYNNPELSSKVHRKQLAFNTVQAPPLGTKALIAGNRSGKTVCTTVDDAVQLIPREEVPPHLLGIKKFDPPCHIWVGAPKYSKHEDTILPLFRRWLPKAQLIEGSFDRSYKSQSRRLVLNCESTVTLKTYDQDIDAWASAEVHRVRWDEEPNNPNGRRMRSEARARLVSTGGDEVIGMTPMLGISTWVFDEVWERRAEPQITVMGMTIHDNPWNSPEAIAQFLDGMSEEERRARESGEFVHFGGRFYDEFRTAVHVVEPPDPKHLQGQDIVVSIDPGLVHTGVTWSAWDSDNAGLFFDEFFPPKTNVAEIAAEIKRRNRLWGLSEPTYVIDPSYRNLTTAIHADAVQANYAREGIYVQPGNNDRRAGILEVKKRLSATDGEGRAHPTLLLSRACPETTRQMERYRRNPDAADEWQAVPQDTHTRWELVDCVRYAVMSRTWEGETDSPFEEMPPAWEYGHEPAYDPNELLIPTPADF